jgi:cell division protein FtsN
MLFGLGLGLIVAIGAYLRGPAGMRATEATIADSPAAAAQPAPRRSRSASESAERAERAGYRFEFYEILPQLEVVLPDGDAPANAGARRSAETPGSYLLQAGSFGAAAEADRMQANLALLGFASHVQRVMMDDHVFHRVRIGPIADLDTAKRTQRRLRDARIDTLLMQVPK